MTSALADAAARFPAEFWATFVEMAPYLLLGLALAGGVERLMPEARVRRWLGGSHLGILRAALIGVPLPLCSCGVVPVALALRRRGASRAATVAFLITTPMSGADSIAATWGMMGPKFAILRTLLTFAAGLAAGYAVQWACGVEESRPRFEGVENQAPKPRLGWLAPGWDLLQSLSGWLLVGIVLSALLAVSIPDRFFSGMGGFMGLITLALVGLPLYVCATSSIPLALEFVHKGFSPGAAFTFLLTGPATNAATGLIIWNELGKRATLTYIGSIAAFGILGGGLIDMLGVELRMSHEGHSHGGPWAEGFAWVLAALMLLSFWLKWRPRKPIALSEATQVLKVQGMTCEHCRMTVTKAIEAVPGARAVSVDLAGGEAHFEGADPLAVGQAVRAAGFNTP